MQVPTPPSSSERLETLARVADGLARQLATERAANDQLRALLGRLDPEPAFVRFARTRRWQLLFVLTTCMTALASAATIVVLFGTPAPAPPPPAITRAVAVPVVVPAQPLPVAVEGAPTRPGRKDVLATIPTWPLPLARRIPGRVGAAAIFGGLPDLAREAAIARVTAHCARGRRPFLAQVVPDPRSGLRGALVRVIRYEVRDRAGCVEHAVRRAATAGRIPRAGLWDASATVMVGGPPVDWSGNAACDAFAARACAGGDQDRCDDAAHLIAGWKELGIERERCGGARGPGARSSARSEQE